MPLKCFNRPNRKQARTWTAKTAAQAVCKAIEAGYTAAELRLQFSDCVPCGENRKRSQAQVQAMAAMQQTVATLDLFAALTEALRIATRGAGLLARFIPQARPLLLALVPLERRLGVIGAEIRVTRAANDAALRALRLAA